MSASRHNSRVNWIPVKLNFTASMTENCFCPNIHAYVIGALQCVLPWRRSLPPLGPVHRKTGYLGRDPSLDSLRSTVLALTAPENKRGLPLDGCACASNESCEAWPATPHLPKLPQPSAPLWSVHLAWAGDVYTVTHPFPFYRGAEVLFARLCRAAKSPASP